MDLKFEDNFSPTECLGPDDNLFEEKSNTIRRINGAPIDPLRDLINSDKYIDSLEKKLQKFKGKQTTVVKAKDMINSLQKAKQEHLTRVINSDHSECYQGEDFTQNSSIGFSIQRKVNPEKQALNPQELLPLVHDDILAKVCEVEETVGSDVT